MSLDAIIPAEIVDCTLARALTLSRRAAGHQDHYRDRLVVWRPVPPAAIVKGMAGHPSVPRLHCLEMSEGRFHELHHR